jgi:predicted DNA-binding protein with PD1-like motif
MGDDVLEHIDAYILQHKIQAGVILSAVGNIQPAVIRHANEKYSEKSGDLRLYP